jgi:glycosyltransferase involved in cell wall biosynthesis
MIETSVIVPFKNAETTLDACLRNVVSQIYRPFEVILVDNDSTDRSRQVVDAFCREPSSGIEVRIFSEARPGASAARNRGAAEARGAFLAFTDADCVAGRDWLADILPVFDDRRIGAVAGNIRGFTATGRVDAFHNLFTLQGRTADQELHCFTLTAGGFPSANLVVRRTVFEQVGGFDEAIHFSGEDYDLCARVYAAGHVIKAISRGDVRHIHRRGLWSTWRQAYYFGQAHGLLLAKHLHRHLILEIGPLVYRRSRGPFSAWVNLSSADKKLLYLFMLSGLHGIFLWLIPLYMVHLIRLIVRRARNHGQKSTLTEAAAMAGALILKSAAMTIGRLAGSVKYGVVCF